MINIVTWQARGQKKEYKNKLLVHLKALAELTNIRRYIEKETYL